MLRTSPVRSRAEVAGNRCLRGPIASLALVAVSALLAGCAAQAIDPADGADAEIASLSPTAEIYPAWDDRVAHEYADPPLSPRELVGFGRSPRSMSVRSGASQAEAEASQQINRQYRELLRIARSRLWASAGRPARTVVGRTPGPTGAGLELTGFEGELLTRNMHEAARRTEVEAAGPPEAEVWRWMVTARDTGGQRLVYCEKRLDRQVVDDALERELRTEWQRRRGVVPDAAQLAVLRRAIATAWQDRTARHASATDG